MALRTLVFIVVAAATIPACSPSLEREYSSYPEVSVDMDTIKRRGYITVLVDNNSISYFIYKGQPMGYEYELLKLLEKELKVSVKIRVISGIENAIEMLNKGEGDILAFPLTITTERKQRVDFTAPHFSTYQVLVQRKPEEWQNLSGEQINEKVIRDPLQLAGKEVHVLERSSFAERLKALSKELETGITVIEDSADTETESLIRKVSLGEIEYTVTDHVIAKVNSLYYPNLDIHTVMSSPQQIAWAVRKNSPELRKGINAWLARIKKEPTYRVIFNRYYESPRTSLIHASSDYSSLAGNKLSRYDELIKSGAESLGWDWRLLAAVIYQESKFNPGDESWAGARGLMQLMPVVATKYKVQDLSNPYQNIRAGVRYLKYLDRVWAPSIFDKDERVKFILASYNAGLSHVMDARRLTEKYGRETSRWNDNVAYFLLKKSEESYYRDPVSKAGYCKCEEPVNYVKEVLSRYEEYKLHIH